MEVQTPLIPATAKPSYGTGDIGNVRVERSGLIDLAMLFRLAVVVLTCTSLILQLIDNNYTRPSVTVACVTALTFLWNFFFVISTNYSPRTWKRRSDNDEPQEAYRRLAPLNDAWLSGYIFMFTLWAKYLPSNQSNTHGRYNIDAIFILNCIVFFLSYVIAVFEQFQISWSRSLFKLVCTDRIPERILL